MQWGWRARIGCIPAPSSRLRARKLPKDVPREYRELQVTDNPRASVQLRFLNLLPTMP